MAWDATVAVIFVTTFFAGLFAAVYVRGKITLMSQPSVGVAAAANAVPASIAGRLLSLDAFRGATMALMILVNTPGDGAHVYWPLEHAKWNGWTPTDVVFPSFLWIVGVAMTLSLGRRLARGDSRAVLFRQAARRAGILFVLGVLVYVYPAFDLSTQRILGVLQRIAICYLAATAIYLTTRLRGQIVWIVSLMAVYWLLMAFAPVPGYGAGRLDLEGNFAHYIDRIVLGSHNYLWTKTWDPEGIVSTLPAIATCLFGVLAGHVVALRRSLGERCLRLLGIGVVLLAAGLICNLWLPINKKLWTDSFTLFMGGLDFVLFAGFLWLVDALGWHRVVKPLVILGMNAIVVYLASELVDEAFTWVHWTGAGGKVVLRDWLYQHIFAGIASPYNASLLYAIAYVLTMYLLAWLLYRRGWFARV
jgi:predicted acyltransferase